MLEDQVNAMMNQIQPHFIYNALNSIRYLCEIDGSEAAEAIDHFSLYLRKNMDSINEKDPVPFLDEIEHVKNYLYIEQLRFPEIHVKYDLRCTNFTLPSLTIQPTVENAIKHGYTMKKKSGTVLVRSYETTAFYCVEVTDDGVGFDPAKIGEDGRNHIGLKNTKRRIELMVEGTYDIYSVLGEGTRVLIKIPKKYNLK